MSVYSRIVILLALGLVAGNLPHSPMGVSSSSFLVSPAHSKSRLRNLLDRLRGQKMPAGIVKTNGRIEATQIDVSSKYAGRLTDVSVDEGSEVKEGQVVGRISSPEVEAQLRAAQSNVDKAQQSLAEAEANIAQQNALLVSAKADFERGQELVAKRTITQQSFDQRRRNYEAAQAGVAAATAKRDQADAAIKSAKAEVERIESVLHDLVLVAPRSGRVQYLLARNGEVLPAGGKVMTVLDLQDVYMTIFLPAASAAKLEFGDEARIVLDPAPQFVLPATVSFVAADAQFTPKSVETQEEREKLMFRVKLKLDADMLKKNSRRVKTGVRGLGIVRTNPATPWPADLQVKLPQ